ncbi:heme ABC exporter ATP-binding protein CcmA [Fodinicurvata halophila]|uniref:Heme ABC exporter ATP-binding protein CcmA n=1 Tax=Fodinicurvata halophila TaxID=1419723 RepID=A0ABV8UKQ4_9PROT
MNAAEHAPPSQETSRQTHRLEVTALDCLRGGWPVFGGLEFKVEGGELLLLTGPNGSGKSSLLRILAGFLPPAAGQILWDGVPLHGGEEEPPTLGYVGHRNALKGSLTLREDLAFWARFHGRPAHLAEEALAAFGLASLAERSGRILSSGQARRLALARLKLIDTPLWLLDEPLVGLDQSAITALRNEIEHYRGEGGIVLLATHQDIWPLDERRLDLRDHAVSPDALEAGT